MPRLSAHHLPQFVSESDLADGTVVVIDLLRASTTITTALAQGATEVVPFRHVEDAQRAAQQEPDRERLLLGGERGGEIIPGFDLGNSPAEYTPERVFGQRILFTTTNGTLALHHARLAPRVLVGAIVNLSAVVEALREEESIHLLCAGTNGHVSRDDQLAAGAIANALAVAGATMENPLEMNDAAQAIHREWLELLNTARAWGRSPAEQLAQELRDTPGGKNLLGIGMQDDLPVCAAIDALRTVPEFDPATGRITAL